MKTKMLAAQDGYRSFALALETGEEAIESLLAFAKAERVDAATFTGLGAFSNVTLGFFDLDLKDYQRNVFDEQVELVSLVGNFASLDDQCKLHCHAVVANRRGQAFGGHLLKALVRPTLEVIVTDAPSHLRRQIDEATGLPLLIP